MPPTDASTPQVLAAVGLTAVCLVLARTLLLDRRPAGAKVLVALRLLELTLLATLLGLMILLSTLQIVFRNLLGAGIIWVDPFLRYLTLWIGFLGAAYATAHGRHIQIDVLARASPPAVRRWATRAVSLVAAIVTCVLAETAYRHVVDEFRFGATGVLDLPTWSLLAVIPAAFALMCYRFLRRALVSVGEEAVGPGGGAGEESRS